MQSLSIAEKLLPGIFFLLLTVLSPLPPCVAVTIEEIYEDEDEEGFKDETALTQAEKEFLSERGNDAETRGEARKNAFEHATSLLESRLTNANTIRISAEFVIFSGQKDPDNQGQCLITTNIFSVAKARPEGYVYPNYRLDEGDSNTVGLGTAHPYALIEAILGEEFNGQEADIAVRFSKCIPFYYGLTESTSGNRIDFVQLSLHEITHGLGFLERVKENGDFPVRTILITGTQNGISFTRSSSIKSRTIYDEQLYSETDDDLLVNLSSSERAAAITSGTGLLWEGLDGARNDCSYGQRMAELKADSAKSQDGKPRIHAPSTYDAGASVSHTHANTEDVMEALGPTPRNMDLTLGMLKDMGWQVSNDGFPPDCTPTGISVTPTSGLVTSELGGEATFEVVLESEPTEDVVIPVSSTDASEGVTDPEVLELRFTPLNWDTPQEVTVRGIDDDSHDGPQDYEITVGKTQSADRFYDGFDDIQKVSVRNDDDDLPPPLFILYDSDAREGEGVMEFTARLSHPSANTVTVEYAITGTTAQEGSDYTPAPANASLTFDPGETENTIRVPVIDDNLDEDDEEEFTITLSNPQNAVLAQNGDTATGIIKDNDEAALHIDDANAGEGAGTMNFTVRLSPQSVRTVTAQYSITGGAAQGGSDYEAASSNGTVTFAPGESRNTISITLIDDGEREANETVAVTLSNPQNAVLAQNGDTATGTIRDNDQPPPPPPPPTDNQVTDNTQLPPSRPEVQQPTENPQQPQERTPATPRPPSAGEEGGGGGCAIASGEGADHTVSTLLNLLPAVFAAFSLLSLKNRP